MEKMTGNKKPTGMGRIFDTAGVSSLSFELKKNAKGAKAIIGGVVSISAYSNEHLELLSHSGRVIIDGDRLCLSLLENRTLEIYGRIKEVRFSYGKA